MKVEPYLNMDYMPDDEEPYFDVVLSTDDASFNIHQMYEKEVRELVQDILDQLDIYMEAFLSSKQKVIE